MNLNEFDTWIFAIGSAGVMLERSAFFRHRGLGFVGDTANVYMDIYTYICIWKVTVGRESGHSRDMTAGICRDFVEVCQGLLDF